MVQPIGGPDVLSATVASISVGDTWLLEFGHEVKNYIPPTTSNTYLDQSQECKVP